MEEVNRRDGSNSQVVGASGRRFKADDQKKGSGLLLFDSKIQQTSKRQYREIKAKSMSSLFGKQKRSTNNINMTDDELCRLGSKVDPSLRRVFRETKPQTRLRELIEQQWFIDELETISQSLANTAL